MLGDLQLLEISKSEVRKSTKLLIEFLQKLKEALRHPSDDPTISFLVENIQQEYDKSTAEWEHDIQELVDALKNEEITANAALLENFEDIINVLNEDYSDALKALYNIYH
jgi:phosphoenolpyruvate carboxylase